MVEHLSLAGPGMWCGGKWRGRPQGRESSYQQGQRAGSLRPSAVLGQGWSTHPAGVPRVKLERGAQGFCCCRCGLWWVTLTAMCSRSHTAPASERSGQVQHRSSTVRTQARSRVTWSWFSILQLLLLHRFSNNLPYRRSPALPHRPHDRRPGSLTSSMLPITQKCCTHDRSLFSPAQRRQIPFLIPLV